MNRNEYKMSNKKSYFDKNGPPYESLTWMILCLPIQKSNNFYLRSERATGFKKQEQQDKN